MSKMLDIKRRHLYAPIWNPDDKSTSIQSIPIELRDSLKHMDDHFRKVIKETGKDFNWLKSLKFWIFDEPFVNHDKLEADKHSGIDQDALFKRILYHLWD